jgi:hypothetical protein
MDDFVYVLIAGLVLLGVAMAVFSLAGLQPSSQAVLVYNFTLGPIGVSDISSTDQDLGSFTVGATNTDSLEYAPQATVSAWLLGGPAQAYTIDIPEDLLDAARDVWVRFTLYDESGEYGDLVIRWNGREMYDNRMDKGPKELFVSRDLLSTRNTLEFYAVHNPVYFWASATYVLRDVDVQLEYGDAKAIPFRISQSQKETFQKGAVSFTASGTGDLVAKVNGVQFHSGPVSGPTLLEFDLFNSRIVTGNNVLSLSVANGSYQLSSATLKLFTSASQAVKDRTFTLTSDQASRLGSGYRGRITMQVNGIGQAGQLILSLNGKRLDTPGLKQGSNVAYFTGAEANEGTNDLSFSGTGQWDFGEVRVEIEPDSG